MPDVACSNHTSLPGILKIGFLQYPLRITLVFDQKKFTY